MPNQRYNVGQRLYDNERAPTSASSPSVPPHSRNGTLRPYSHVQSSPQRQISREPAVLGEAASYAGFGEQPTVPVPGTGNGVDALSRPMPGQLNGPGFTDHISASQTRGYPFFRGPVPIVTNTGFGGRNGARLLEGHNRCDEQESLEIYHGYQRLAFCRHSSFWNSH